MGTVKTLGISMIVRNESKCIEACLNSVKNADEIVIADTGSKDNTVELCKKYTDKVYTDYKWRDDFAEARNYSLSKCTADYILIIDADEILITPIEKIKKFINEYWFRQYFGLTFIVKTALETLESPRLFKNIPEIYYVNAIHNLPSWKDDTFELKTRMYSSVFTIDSGFSDSHNLDPDRSFRILRSELKSNPLNTRNMYYLAKEYMNRKNIKMAVKWFEKYRKIKYFNCLHWDNELAHALYCLALCYCDIETWGKVRWFEAVLCAQESWSVLPTSSDVAKLLMELFGEMQGSEDKAIRRQILTHAFWQNMLEGVPMKRIDDEGKIVYYKSCDETGVLVKMNT
jgi:glycosyltransferase involved in cell wall biosynthesis